MNKEAKASLAWGGGIIAVALGATLARQLDYIDADTVTRVIALNGLMVALYGNRMPKSFVPDAQARRIARVGGWSMVLSGLAYAGLWAFAPLDVAVIAGCGAIIAGIAITFAYGLSLRAKTPAAKS